MCEAPRVSFLVHLRGEKDSTQLFPSNITREITQRIPDKCGAASSEVILVDADVATMRKLYFPLALKLSLFGRSLFSELDTLCNFSK